MLRALLAVVLVLALAGFGSCQRRGQAPVGDADPQCYLPCTPSLTDTGVRWQADAESAAAWDALGLTLSTLREIEGLVLSEVRRSFALDILLAFSCREAGVTLVTANARDMERIQTVFSFEYVKPFPEQA